MNTYVFYERTLPFPGYIRMTGQVNMAQLPDGSTIAERLEALRVKYPDANYFLFPPGIEVDKEAVKFDVATETLVPLEPGDVTPKMQAELDRQAQAQDIIDNLPSWAQVEDAVAAIANLQDAKIFLRKLARVVYWLAKNSND